MRELVDALFQQNRDEDVVIGHLAGRKHEEKNNQEPKRQKSETFWDTASETRGLPVSLLENETLLLDPGPPALSAHPLPRVDHSGRETCQQRGKDAFQTDLGGGVNICLTQRSSDQSSEELQRPGNTRRNYLRSCNLQVEHRKTTPYIITRQQHAAVTRRISPIK